MTLNISVTVGAKMFLQILEVLDSQNIVSSHPWPRKNSGVAFSSRSFQVRNVYFTLRLKCWHSRQDGRMVEQDVSGKEKSLIGFPRKVSPFWKKYVSCAETWCRHLLELLICVMPDLWEKKVKGLKDKIYNHSFVFCLFIFKTTYPANKASINWH